MSNGLYKCFVCDEICEQSKLHHCPGLDTPERRAFRAGALYGRSDLVKHGVNETGGWHERFVAEAKSRYIKEAEPVDWRDQSFIWRCIVMLITKRLAGDIHDWDRRRLIAEHIATELEDVIPCPCDKRAKRNNAATDTDLQGLDPHTL